MQLSALQNGFLRLLVFFDDVPKTENFDFLKVNAYKIKHLQVIQKIRIYVIQLQTTNIQNVKAMSLFLGVKL